MLSRLAGASAAKVTVLIVISNCNARPKPLQLTPITDSLALNALIVCLPFPETLTNAASVHAMLVTLMVGQSVLK